jgi:radical SAM superfamily enzyme YgiQ (UPF0313 family)
VARVFLINPPSPEPVRTPLLSFCHLASSLRAGGHEVAVADCSAPAGPKDPTSLIEAFKPDLVGLHLKTLHVQPAYALATTLAERWTLVAGGPHATICPDEVLAHGFTYAVRGEGEETLVELADAVDGKRPFAEVRSLSTRGQHNPSRGFLTDLDALACPTTSLDLFDPAWYGATRTLPPAGFLSSRGCPAACTFCANNVTGRRFRYRSATSIVDEIRKLKLAYGQTAFNFFDDSFAVGARRVAELCAALEPERVMWTCTAHPAHLGRDTLKAMKKAGCGGIDIGMESADPEMLVQIGKGVTVERVLDVLRWCQELGIHTIVNLMFGWPDETDEQLDATIDFMARAAPFAAGFNARGVLVPYPGTEVYDRHHERFGFTRWWIDEAPLAYPPFPTAWSEDEVKSAYAADPALARNFFHHSPRRLARMQEALAMKAELTIGRAYKNVNLPAAGAR